MNVRSHITTLRCAAAVAVTVLIGGLIALEVTDARVSRSGSAIGASVLDIAGLLDERSPGERTEAELVKSEERVRSTGTQKAPDEVSERVLGKVFPPQVDDQYALPLVELLEDVSMPTQTVALSTDADVGLVPGLPLSPVFGGGPGWVAGPGGGGGGGGGGPILGPPVEPPLGPPPLEPPADVPAVPEPSTWVMMLMGAALCGASMRRQRRLQLRSAL